MSTSHSTPSDSPSLGVYPLQTARRLGLYISRRPGLEYRTDSRSEAWRAAFGRLWCRGSDGVAALRRGTAVPPQAEMGRQCRRETFCSVLLHISSHIRPALLSPRSPPPASVYRIRLSMAASRQPGPSRPTGTGVILSTLPAAPTPSLGHGAEKTQNHLGCFSPLRHPSSPPEVLLFLCGCNTLQKNRLLTRASIPPVFLNELNKL